MLGDQEMEQLDKTRFHDKIEYIQGGDPWIGGKHVPSTLD
jgi:hypothetical protein